MLIVRIVIFLIAVGLWILGYLYANFFYMWLSGFVGCIALVGILEWIAEIWADHRDPGDTEDPNEV